MNTTIINQTCLILTKLLRSNIGVLFFVEDTGSTNIAEVIPKAIIVVREN